MPNPEIKTSVHIPPRRRSAVLEVELSDGRTAKAAVNKNEVKLSLKGRSRYGASDTISIPRNLDDIEAIASLLTAAAKEVVAQDNFVEEESRAAEKETP